jgi:hypothetical protein
MLLFLAKAMAEQIEGRRELQTLAAGVLKPTVDGVIKGVGKGPIRARAGVGGAMSGFGSRKRGSTVSGVGVLSCDVESTGAANGPFFVGVGVVGEDSP